PPELDGEPPFPIAADRGRRSEPLRSGSDRHGAASTRLAVTRGAAMARGGAARGADEAERALGQLVVRTDGVVARADAAATSSALRDDGAAAEHDGRAVTCGPAADTGRIGVPMRDDRSARDRRRYPVSAARAAVATADAGSRGAAGRRDAAAVDRDR